MTGITKAVCLCCPVCGMVHIKDPLLLIEKRFPLLLSEHSFIICPMPYNHKQNVLSVLLNKTFSSFLPVVIDDYTSTAI